MGLASFVKDMVDYGHEKAVPRDTVGYTQHLKKLTRLESSNAVKTSQTRKLMND